MREKILPDQLIPGESLPKSLYDQSGKMVVSAGSILSEDRIQKLCRRYYKGLFRDEDPSQEPPTSSDEITPTPSAQPSTAVIA